MSIDDLQNEQGFSGARLNDDTRWEHWKYPETLGSDSGVDDINFNSHQASEYAIDRMSAIDPITKEPFIMFEFLKVSEELAQNKSSYYDSLKAGFEVITSELKDLTDAAQKGYNSTVGTSSSVERAKQAGIASGEVIKAQGDKVATSANEIIKSMTTPAERLYTGSIAMYMPTDIAINDTIMYNEDSRKFAAALNELLVGQGMEAFENKAVALSKGAFAGYGAAASKLIPKSGSALGALAGYGLGDIISNEMQRATGALLNPNEFLQYQSTPLRTFTFNWTFLPDSANESRHAAGIIKFFRKSAHAKKNSQITLTVPDHCIVSFHGAGGKDVEMIQLPPVVVESVNVTYNPNTTSFFKINNAPVEIKLSVGLKEMAPLYNDDIKAGY